MKLTFILLMIFCFSACVVGTDEEQPTTSYYTTNTVQRLFVYSLNALDETITVFQANSNMELQFVQTLSTGAGSRTLVPYGNYLYSTNGTDNTISVWAVDVETGLLNEIQTVSTTAQGDFPNGIYASAGKLFVSLANSNKISSYSMNASGMLSLIGTVDAGISPQDIQVVDNYLLAANYSDGTISSFTISDIGLLTLNEHKATGVNPFRMGLDKPNRRLFVPSKANNSVQVFFINPGGLLTSTDVEAVGNNPSEAHYYNGRLYVTNRDDDTVMVFTTNSDGTLTKIQDVASVCSQPFSMTSVDNFLAVTCEGDSSVSYYSIGSDGTLSNKKSTPVGASPYDLEYVITTQTK